MSVFTSTRSCSYCWYSVCTLCWLRKRVLTKC